MKFLFLGGTWDGQRRTLPGKPPERFTVMVERAPVFDEDFHTTPIFGELDYDEYHRRSFQCAGVEFVVYTHGWMDHALVMQRLLDGYKDKA